MVSAYLVPGTWYLVPGMKEMIHDRNPLKLHRASLERLNDINNSCIYHVDRFTQRLNLKEYSVLAGRVVLSPQGENRTEQQPTTNTARIITTTRLLD